ncbi:MAG: DUF3833 domain-containing protein [Pseudomonadota bacterium]
MNFLVSTLSMVSVVIMSGCASVPLESYSQNTPVFDPRKYFDGSVTAWGMVQDWRGEVTRRFSADIRGEVMGNEIKLTEDFNFSDGEISQRVWQLRIKNDNEISGFANDTVGLADGQIIGNAMTLRYLIDLNIEDKTYRVKFDDKLWQIDSDVVINRASIKKFGIKVGQVTLFMRKLPISDYQAARVIHNRFEASVPMASEITAAPK